MIYDCILFFNEVEILKLRLEEIGDLVDKIILIEGSHTYSKVPKISFYEKYKYKFEKYNNKILHFIVDLSHLLPKETIRFDYEFYQRNYINTILKELKIKDEDIILISDVDEIPYNKDIKKGVGIINNFKNRIIFFHMNEYRYFFNYKQSTKYISFIGTFMIKYKILKNLNIQNQIRQIYCNHRTLKQFSKNFSSDNVIILKNSGLHLSSFGGAHCVIYKLQNYSHEEFDNKEKKRITDNPVISSETFNENNEEWRINNNFYKWYDFSKIEKMDYKDFKNIKLNDNLFDTIIQDRDRYKNFFLFAKGL